MGDHNALAFNLPLFLTKVFLLNFFPCKYLCSYLISLAKVITISKCFIFLYTSKTGCMKALLYHEWIYTSLKRSSFVYIYLIRNIWTSTKLKKFNNSLIMKSNYLNKKIYIWYHRYSLDKAYHIIEYYALKVIRHFEHMQIIHGRFIFITSFTCKTKYRVYTYI